MKHIQSFHTKAYKEDVVAFELDYDHVTSKCIISNNQVIIGLVYVLNTLIWSTSPSITDVEEICDFRKN